jgi:3-hydroxybutyryl-CoA dehydrogenase
MVNYIVTGSDAQWNILQQYGSGRVQWQRATAVNEATIKQADAFFYLLEDAAAQDFGGIAVPVFVNSITSTLKGCNAVQVAGTNGWPYFLQQPNWEMAGQLTDGIKAVAKILGKTIIPAPDGPGFTAPRVITTIINEAYFALQDGVSSREDIDTAMKMGTNYPYGPFEWAGLIGLHHVYSLLQKLAETDERYTPAPLLQKEATV